MNPVKKLLLSAAIASALSSAAVFSCGWSETEYYYYSKSLDILYGELTKQHFVRRYSYFPGSYAADEYDEAQAVETYNLQAWSDYLKVSKEDARAIVYERAADKLASQPEAVNTYLNIVAKQEPIATQGDPRWLTKEERATQQAENETLGAAVISEITTQLEQTQDPFLRQRYAYLLVRLQHYLGHYQAAIDAYTHYQSAIQQPDKEIATWTGLVYAGALQRSGKRVEAAYQFATLLPQTTTKKLEAQLNFRIKSDDEWNALMALCKNKDEQALMHFVRALSVNANSLAELKTVYELAPNSDWFDALLFRELEYVQFADTVPGNDAQPWLQAARGINQTVLIDDLGAYESAKTEAAKAKLHDRRTQYLQNLSDFVAQVRQEKTRQDLFLSDYAALYLPVLTGQPIEVAAVKSLSSRYPNDPRLAYVKPLEHLVYLANLQRIDGAAEAILSEDLMAIKALEKPVNTGSTEDEYNNPYKRRTQDITTYTYAKLEPLYRQANQPGKAYLAQQRGDIETDAITVAEIRDLQTLQAKTNPNRWEQQMLADFNKSFGEVDYDTNQFVINADPSELMARKYLAAGELDQAKAAAEQAKGKYFKTTYNPFTAGRSGNNRIKSKSMTLLEVITTLQKLEAEAAQNPNNAQNQFLLGTAYYNLTWFGNSPILLKNHRSTVSWRDGVIDFSKARQHYEQALQNTSDRELKVKTLYALAKIENNEFYIHKKQQGKKIADYWPRTNKDYANAVKYDKQNGVGNYFRQIRRYEDTQYFKDVIKQCADYRYYFTR